MLMFMQVGDRITAGDIYGVVKENTLMDHKVMLPPGARGTISYIAAPGEYTVNDEVIEIEFQVRVHEMMLSLGRDCSACQVHYCWIC